MNLEQDTALEALKDSFISFYGNSQEKIIFAASPARINIIGEHIDYNGGLVLPAAVNLYLRIALRKRKDKKILYRSMKTEKIFEFELDGNLGFDKENDFANYLNGMFLFLKERGLKADTGFELLITSDIPQGSGISSSAALELCFGKIISHAFGFELDGIEFAKIGRRVENEFLGLKSGIMDQFAIAMGKKNQALLLDTSSLNYEYIPLETEPYRIVIMNSNKPRKLTESKYNERKEECEKALAFLQKKTDIDFLCDLSVSDFEKLEEDLISNLGEKLFRRVRHCVTEMDRVRRSAEALKNKDLKLLGASLNQSHLSLKDDYEVTGKELDALFFAAIKEKSCIGARMTGAGFSGCAIAIVHKDGFEEFAERVGKAYTENTGFTASFFACQASDGVSVISI